MRARADAAAIFVLGDELQQVELGDHAHWQLAIQTTSAGATAQQHVKHTYIDQQFFFFFCLHSLQLIY